jgi:cytoskeletal protein RodZ
MEKPSLTEPGVKFFMSKVLKNCSEQKHMFSNLVFNIILFLVFVLIIGGFLYYKYRGKLTPEEKERKFREEKQDVLMRLNALNVNIEKTRKNGANGANLITDLPMWDVQSSDVIVNPYK